MTGEAYIVSLVITLTRPLKIKNAGSGGKSGLTRHSMVFIAAQRAPSDPQGASVALCQTFATTLYRCINIFGNIREERRQGFF